MSDRLSTAREALAAAEAAAGASPAGSASPAGGGPGQGDGSPAAGAGRRRPGSREPDSGEPGGDEPDPHDVARRIVLRQLTMAPRSRAELEDKLRRRGCDETVARTVLDRMTDVGLVDDQAYARMLVRSRQEGKGLARKGLAHELRRKGLDDEVVEAALEDVDPHVETNRARELVDKKLRTMHGLDREVQTRRLSGLLARKGYAAGIAYQVIREALDQAPEHRRD